MQSPTEALKSDIKAFRKRHNFTKTGFGVMALSDPNLVFDLEKGRELRWPTIEVIRNRMTSLDAERQSA